MIYIFPMGGRGKRTQELGQWKPFIEVQGKYMFEYAVSDINFTDDDTIIFITAKPVIPDWGEKVLNQRLKNRIKNYEVIILDEVQAGPGMTIYNGLKKSKKIKHDENIHIINVDQSIKYQSFELTEPGGIMPVWFNSKGNSCYVKLMDDKPLIINIKEKELISFHASSGVYIFSSLEILNKSIEWGIMNKSIWTVSSGYNTEELFIGPCMSYLIENNFPVWATTTYKKMDLGTSNELKNYIL